MFLAIISIVVSSCINEPIISEKFDGPTIAKVGPDNNLYVADGYYNSRIAVFTLDGKFLREWGTRGYGKGQLQNPHGCCFTNDGYLLVADRDNSRIQKFTTNGEYLTEFTSNSVGRPWDISVSNEGEIFIVDGGDQDVNYPRSAVIKLNSGGEVVCRFSSYGHGSAELDNGHSITVSPEGNEVYVVDLGNSRIQRFLAESDKKDKYNIDIMWKVKTGETSIKPLGITLDGDTLYVTQQNAGSPVLLIDKNNGTILKQVGSGLFRYAHGISVDKQKRIWVADKESNKIYRMDTDGNILLTIGETE